MKREFERYHLGAWRRLIGALLHSDRLHAQSSTMAQLLKAENKAN